MTRAQVTLSRNLVRACLTGIGAVAAGVGVHAARRMGTPESPFGSLTKLPDGREFHTLWQRGSETGPTVVFENALVCSATEWLWVADALGAETSFLAYDRCGIGWSPSHRGVNSPESYTGTLRELLAALQLPAPYVLVGHSVGGLLIRAFAASHPGLVGGLVFADASHPDQWARSEIQRHGMPWVKQRLLEYGWRALLGLPGGVTTIGETDSLPDGGGTATAAMLRLPRPWLGAYREVCQVERAWSEAARSLSCISPKPVAVVTAGETVARDPAHLNLQKELAELSNFHRHKVVDEASHESLVMRASHATAVVDALRWALRHCPP